MKRVNVYLPDELLEALDNLVGYKSRSEAVRAAIRDLLRKEREVPT